MNSSDNESFPAEVVQHLKTYVYRLIDPRNGETFYVGKGKGNRVFAHSHAEEDLEGDALDNRLKRIRQIRLAGFEVAHVIHRHGMDENTAFEVEAALIDAYPGLTNVVGGTASDRGAMHAKEVIARYAAEPAVFYHDVLLISVGRSTVEVSLYEGTRFCWKVDRARAEQVELVLPVIGGIIVGAFVAEKWLPATPDNFPGHEAVPGRHGFVGHEASPETQAFYVGRRVPERKRGARNPIRYVPVGG